jgi:hypothetical protein
VNQFIVGAVAEKVGVMETAREFLERRRRCEAKGLAQVHCATRDASSRSDWTGDRGSRTSEKICARTRGVVSCGE